MPRFVARPVVVEAFQWSGHTHELPESFRMAVTRHLVGGMVEIRTGDGARQCAHRDWIVRGPEGQFSVLKGAAFETMFAEHTPPAEQPTTRKAKINA